MTMFQIRRGVESALMTPPQLSTKLPYLFNRGSHGSPFRFYSGKSKRERI